MAALAISGGLTWAHAQSPTDAPLISPQNPTSFEAGIRAAYAAGARKIVIPEGVYRLDQTIRLENISNFEIDAQGVTLLRADPTKMGIEFIDCANVSLVGVTVLCEKLPFTQGAIDRVDPTGAWFELAVDAGYPLDYFNKPSTYGHAFDPTTRQWKPGVGDFHLVGIEQVDATHFRFRPDVPVATGRRALSPGDLMAFRGRGESSIHLLNCSKMKIDDVTILSGGGFGIFEEYGNGDNHYSYRITYGPNPVGATDSPLMSSMADGFHSWCVRHGPTLENCMFEGMCDDGIAIHGFFGMVFAVDGSDIVIAQSSGRNTVIPGDDIRFFNGAGDPVGEGKATTCRIENEVPLWKATGKTFRTPKRFYRLTLDHPLPVQPGFLISTPDAEGSHFVIRNCTIHNNRGRGIIVKADDGVIEGNSIEGSTMCAVVVAPEFSWNEASYGRDIVIRNNVFRHIGYAMTGPDMAQAGVVTVQGAEGAGGSGYGNQRVRIQSNRFEQNDGAQIVMESTEDASILDNAFSHVQWNFDNRGSARKIDSTALIFLRNCKGVVASGNTVSDRGSCGKALITAMDDVLEFPTLSEGFKATPTPSQN